VDGFAGVVTRLEDRVRDLEQRNANGVTTSSGQAVDVETLRAELTTLRSPFPGSDRNIGAMK